MSRWVQHSNEILQWIHCVDSTIRRVLSPQQIQFISGATPNTILSLADYHRIPTSPDLRTLYLQNAFGGYYETTCTKANPCP